MKENDVIGIAGTMPGTDGFTMAAFLADNVPVGTELFIKPQESRWKTGTPLVKKNDYTEFIVAVRRSHSPDRVVVRSAFYANDYSEEIRDRDGNPYTADGWYDMGHDTTGEFNDLFMPMLHPGDEVLGWQELPKWNG